MGLSEKKYLNKTVYDAAIERLEFIFENFERIYFSISFGKDSTVMLNLARQVAEKMDRLPLTILFIDLEGQYKSTIKYAESVFAQDWVDGYWICLPLNLRNSVSVFQPYWTCWDEVERNKWIREKPQNSKVIDSIDFFPFFRSMMEFEDFVVKFAMWFANGQKTACGVGIRTQESLHRYCAVKKQTDLSTYLGKNWSTKIRKNVYNFYPIYDWKVEDIWTAIGDHNWSYSKIYDFMYISGMNLHNMRICQPYGDDQRRGLDLFAKAEPEIWAKVVDRVSGANFGNIYCRSHLLGHQKALLPDGHTWQSYTKFLLATIPKYQRRWYLKKIHVWEEWWKENHYPRNKWFDNTPSKRDNKELYLIHDKLPSWERIAKTILRNDILCKSLCFGQSPRSWDKYQHMRSIYGY